MADHFEQSRNLLSHFEGRRARAAERLTELPSVHWNFAILGLRSEIDRFSFDVLGEFRRVEEPPGEVELASALKDGTLFGAIGRYSHGITHELAIGSEFSTGQAAFNMAWWMISALRVRTLAEFLVPAAADYSWSTIAALKQKECNAKLLEDVPRARRVDAPVTVEAKDFEWVNRHLRTMGKLLEEPQFRLAVEALTTHQHLVSPRMMAASIWAGIEALVDIKAELRFRLALAVSVLLEPRGKSRIACYREVKRSYDDRSAAVHGAKVSDGELLAHVSQARKVLSRMLCAIIESGEVPTVEKIEELLLG